MRMKKSGGRDGRVFRSEGKATSTNVVVEKKTSE